MNAYTLRAWSDAELDAEAQLLERKVVALRTATSALGIRLHERYASRLDQVRAEIERRAQETP
jgi:hypothetical protein